MQVRGWGALLGAVAMMGATAFGADGPQTSWVLNRGPDGARLCVAGGVATRELGLLSVRATTHDVQLFLPETDDFRAEERPYFAIRYRIRTDRAVGGLFFTTGSLTRLCDRSFTPFPIVGDGTWRQAVVDMRKSPHGEWKGVVTSFRLDPVNPSADGDAVEVSRLGFFPDPAACERFLAAADDTPDYGAETFLDGPGYRCRIPGGTLADGWRRVDYALASTNVPAGDGVLTVCRDGTPVPAAVSPRGAALYVADAPGRYELKRVRPDAVRPYGVAPVPQWDRARFQIGAYCLNPPSVRTREVIRDIRACGIDFIVGVPVTDVRALDFFAEAGVGVVATAAFPGWWGGDGSRAGKMKDDCPLAAYRACARKFRDHPALIAADIGDEPSALDFPHYGAVVRQIQADLPGLPLYLNLYPNYASVAENSGRQTFNQLGTPTYLEHVARYAADVPLPYLSYDFYPYMNADGVNDRFRLKMYDNFRIVADSCRATGRDFWYIPQVNSRYADLHMTENTLRFQAHAAMAFGAVSITWGCYTPGWWTNNVIRADGTPNVEYGRLQKVNGELRRLGEPFMRYRNLATHFVGFPASEKLDTVGIAVADRLAAAGFADLAAADGAPLLVGEMAARDGSAGRALFVLAADDMYDRHPATHRVRFRSSRPVRACGGNGPVAVADEGAGVLSVPLASNAAVLLVAE